ncbi:MULTISPECIES: HAD family hydrolase [Burkholderia]|uniref:HAD family hydrolase n=5 Tax=Burkholderia cenocepacia TaxID=95486 RepID=A0A1V2W3V8_9BURK|nr:MULTISPECIES: HAD family phosphatase [Burkholderia]KIS46744.1 HAD hydrolase, IA, variant 3 family protein [Burkholderia cepacia]ALV56282.1 HAD family hydrolase [Burkholderia cenocepacia]AQQ50657.1 HAD family hydrolase [Burkholderia cenocepacia]EPZ86379.1 haloacid dehalogenase-like hydrolase [Burkholderia cenocepacia K56-2Valvano]ERI27249.1 haloacid dehalogenase-like hydrolase [Burkholderia cenocepacia BC7]
MTFSAALFDMDGLLVDSERTIMNTWIDVSNAHGVVLTEIDYLQIVGRSFAEGQVILARLIGDPATFDAVRVRVREQLAAPEPHPKFPLKPGAFALLDALAQAGIPCAVASSSAGDVIRARLGAVGVLPFFRAIAGGDEVARGKPDPAVYRLAAERLGVPAHACVAFEDSDFGAQSAAGAGAAVVTVPDLKAPTPEIVALSLHVLASLDDAIALVPSWFGLQGTSQPA